MLSYSHDKHGYVGIGMKRERYEIRVEGRLGSSWADWFEGLEIRDEPDQAGLCWTTVLSGTMDQAALHGTLTKIRDLGIRLLSVRIAPRD
jgi:hypothetical protein